MPSAAAGPASSLVLAGLFAAAMSTIDTCVNVMGLSLAYDVVGLECAGYTQPADPATYADVYLYDMGTALDAFGDMVRLELMLQFGYYVTESSEHSAEYMPYWIKKSHPELIDRYNIPLDEYPRRCVSQIAGWERMRQELVGALELLGRSCIEVLGEDGWVTGLRCVKMKLGEPDDSGRARPIPIEGSEFVFPVDNVVLSIGTAPNPMAGNLLGAVCGFSVVWSYRRTVAEHSTGAWIRYTGLYAAEMIEEIVGGLNVAQRWGVAEGQLALASKMINSQAINRIVRQYIDGQIDAAQAADWLVRYALMSPQRAQQRVRFIDAYRSYVINYNLGKDLVRRYVEAEAGESPEKRWEVCAELLSSLRLPSDLL